jgi:hypothetical protein
MKNSLKSKFQELKVKKYFLISLLLVLAFFIVHCSKDNITSPQENVQMGEVVFDEADADVYQGSLAKGSLNLINEIRLKYFAKAIAITLESPRIRSLLKEEIGKKFDGDYDVLWEMVKDSDIPGRGKFRKVVGNRFGKGSFLSIGDIEGVPLLQISLPVNFEKWDGDEPILVAYTPLIIDDTEWEEIYAYDSEGNERVLDAKVEPDFPVIVVGINERVDDQGKLTKNTAVNAEYVKLMHCKLIDDHEPWSSGSPEIYLLYVDTTVKLQQRKNMYSEWTSWGSNGHWHSINDILFEWHDEYSKVWSYIWREKDGGSTVTFKFKITENIEVSWSCKSGDDDLGTQFVHKDDTLGRSKDFPYSNSDCYFVLDF